MRMVGRMRLGPSRGPVILSSRARLRQIQFATRLSGQFDPQRPAPIAACAGGGGTPVPDSLSVAPRMFVVCKPRNAQHTSKGA
ncbi:hypothetical protein J2W46_002463 [Paraburkholderia strydomiana]|nr:hypothetical protein [Paraburkholderia strydomiana]